MGLVGVCTYVREDGGSWMMLRFFLDDTNVICTEETCLKPVIRIQHLHCFNFEPVGPAKANGQTLPPGSKVQPVFLLFRGPGTLQENPQQLAMP